MIKKLFQWSSRPVLNKRVKVPTILQMEATECGAASLAMILAYYGLWIPLEQMRQECGVDRNGSKASSILKAARKHKCDARGYRWSADLLLEKNFSVDYSLGV